ncbi:glycosyl hydrolase family 8 [Metabacillus iocasae]|uniref:Glycosyl hydrolase family 8 n=1 Tax=Priestia iocasae TaxID=2291674 RepID=A0ABS2QV95_9BACI|nr:glycosyl hydrolase family 8 [Metabacillus iocasae]MBM7702394.1 hypothetical protein [Metabacillus iocasae]
MKQMKRILILLSLASILIGGGHYVKKRWDMKKAYATEQFVKKHMINDNGTIATYRNQTDEKNDEFALGRESLSESSGLWLHYLVRTNQYKAFDQHLSVVYEHFLHKEKKLLYWKIGEVGEINATTNAFIDDLRVIEALYMAYEKWEDLRMRKLADEMSKAVITYQQKAGMFMDYYDMKHEWLGSQITLSYIIPEAFFYMTKYHKLPRSDYLRMVHFLKDIPTKAGFFPKNYQVEEKAFIYDKKINLIDQSYIAYHLATIGEAHTEYADWVYGEFDRNGKLFGSYSRNKHPLTNDESPALYGITILYFLQIGYLKEALELYERMIAFRTSNPMSRFYGGYVTLENKDTHIFDNLFPLLAEDELVKRGLLETKLHP